MDFKNSSAFHYLELNTEKMQKKKWAKIKDTDCKLAEN